MHIIRRDPRTLGFRQSRWQLATLATACEWLAVSALSSLSRLLRRLGIRYKRGRDYVHSPDPHYDAKRAVIDQARQQAQAAPDRFVFYYLDQVSYYRQPTIAPAYAARGPEQPLARRSYRNNTLFRAQAALNAQTGQVIYGQRSHTTLPFLAAFWYQLQAAHPQAECIYVALDNWPVHFHPDVLAPLRPQHFPFPPKTPPNWPTAPTHRARVDQLPIQLLCLPTYASWLNPVEKLWRWLRQDVLHMHRMSDDWPGLKARVATFLDQFQYGSPALLRYVGLLPN